MVAIIIITMAIIEAEVAVAMVVTFIDHMVKEEAITKAIIISVGAGKPKYMLQNVPLNQCIFQKSYFLQVKRISVNK